MIQAHNNHQANQVSYNLRHPLYLLVANIASSALNEQIGLLVGHCIAAIICIIPAAILWLVGKIVYLANPMKLDVANIAKGPKSLPLPDPSNTRDVEVDRLNDIVDDMVSESNYPDEPSDFSDTRGVNKTTKSRLIKQLVAAARLRNDTSVFPDDPNNTRRNQFYDHLNLYLKEIILLLEGSSITDNEKEGIINRLAEARVWCYPTWLEEAKAIYEESQTDPSSENTNSDPILEMVRDYKEDIVKVFVQQDMGGHWHGLNVFRALCGRDVGIKQAGLDGYANANYHAAVSGICKWIFMQKYENTQRLIEAIANRINMKMSTDSNFYNNILEPQLRYAAQKANPEITYSDVKICLYFDTQTDEYDDITEVTINFAGTELLLRYLGILT